MCSSVRAVPGADYRIEQAGHPLCHCAANCAPRAAVSVAEHKEAKGLTSHNLRDHMSEAELIFTALAELSTRQIAENADGTGVAQNKVAAKAGGRFAAPAHSPLESPTGKSVVTGAN